MITKFFPYFKMINGTWNEIPEAKVGGSFSPSFPMPFFGSLEKRGKIRASKKFFFAPCLEPGSLAFLPKGHPFCVGANFVFLIDLFSLGEI